MSEEQYLPIKESLGYRNVKKALWSIFLIDLDDIQVREGEYENFGFTLHYKDYSITMILSGTGKHTQFEFGEGGKLSILLPNPKDTLWGSSNLYELISDKVTKEKLEYIFGKNEKDVEYAMHVLKDYLDSDEAKVFPNK
ncbi:TPA: hypothetical protein TUM56_000753 [Streptococcus equi subsp. zooepidemicus]|uniref:hypothetical protein n=1 Tax=Streptococcus equi TaxID=1336 RepID=UPI001E2E6816|nr:hypothetical protein [Streptococcus equi]UFR17663.1 hypothetical protein KV238_06015 [Streptococcus equi subsp. zooepidemicus]HEL0007468.1 hypothetical protein [Streptococcus equi subsp. zooepidemicus]HEL0114612.1 hypothetical protein [Streptococcus equi subsp. zooepidemicus]HEL0116650.1 hypothetical protein [Streptococcus equi subsp. zooepidemicus]HEL0118661.1 hypothetical protein [Streptococcus equi subsp. zooepidemicus]